MSNPLSSVWNSRPVPDHFRGRKARFYFPKRRLQAWAQFTWMRRGYMITDEEVEKHLLDNCNRLADLSNARTYEIVYNVTSELLVVIFYLPD